MSSRGCLYRGIGPRRHQCPRRVVARSRRTAYGRQTFAVGNRLLSLTAA